MNTDIQGSLLNKTFAIMGVVNVTPDSFYDGGRHASTDAAVEHGLRLCEEGADILDIGGESTRPGAVEVSADEEKRRVLPVVERLAQRSSVPLCVDTTKADVAAEALDKGASWVNDISAGRFDGGMAGLVAKRQCPVVLMHSRGKPQTMQQNPLYDEVVTEVREEILERVQVFEKAGVARENIIVDPGIGFGKRIEDNLIILKHLDRIADMGFPVLIGTSRKSFVGHITGRPAEQRLSGTLGSVAAAFLKGARIFRVHDVAETADCLKVLAAVLKA